MRSTDPELLAIEVQPHDPRPPVGPLAGPRGSGARGTHLELATSAGLQQRPAAQGGRTSARSGFRRLVRPARSRAAGDRAGSAGPLHGPHARGGRRHDPCRGWGARSFVAVARRSFAAPTGAAASRLAAMLSAMSGRRRATLSISGGNGAWRRRSSARATGAACSIAARPHGQGLAPFNQASPRP